jgi:nucleoside-diphosphate-sugar epimerase
MLEHSESDIMADDGKKRRVLVTGGAGYVGTSLIPQLLASQFKVRVVDNLGMGGLGLLPFFATTDFELVKGDVTSREVMERAVRDVDYIVHLAAIVGFPACRKHPELSRNVNVGGMRVLSEVAPPNVPILFASTGSAYGRLIGNLCTETSPLNPVSDYGRQKVQAEESLVKRGRFVIYRFATAYGVSPRMRLDLLPNDFTYRAVVDKTLIVYEKEFLRTFIHVRDMGRAFLFAINNFEAMQNEAYNVGHESQNVSKEGLCYIIRDKLRERGQEFFLHFADVGKDFDQRDYAVSYEKIRNAGFLPSITIEEGINELLRAAEVLEQKNPFVNA